MKKTFTINISGTVFHIEEDAYEVLQKYLVKLKNHFGNEEEGKEILADIEARIAEIFAEKSSDEKRVITLLLVEQVIETMGTPEDFAEEEGEDEEEFVSQPKRKRRLYRDPEHRVLGGVCGGLGAYFNIDPVILRIIFVVLLIITSIVPALLAYLVLWIAVPKAITTAQRLEMRGQEATVKNIEKSIREEVKEVKESYKKFKESDTYSRGKKKVDGAGEVTYNVFRLLLKVAVVVIGVILIISGFFGLLGLISSLIIGQSFVQGWPLIWTPEINFPDFLNYLVEPGAVKSGLVTVGFLAGIPMLAMLYVGSKMVFRYKSNNTAIGLGLVGVWLLSLIALVVISTSQISNFKNQASVVESVTVDCDSCQTLYLKLAEDKYKGYAAQAWDLNKLKVMVVEGDRVILGNPRLDIDRASGNSFLVTVKKSSRGRTREIARDHASDLVYKYQVQDSVLFFEPYFFLEEGDKWRDQEVHITVKVPEGGTVFLDERMVDIIYDIDNVTNTLDGDMVGKYWEMKPDGLTLKELAE
jgi:phage shock protein PspC (stress-responsive transcriptional regulator)